MKPGRGDREEFRLGLLLGFAAGVVASILSVPVVLEVIERIAP